MPSLDDLKKELKVKIHTKDNKGYENGGSGEIKKAQENAEKGRPYSEKLQNIILNLTRSISRWHKCSKIVNW